MLQTAVRCLLILVYLDGLQLQVLKEVGGGGGDGGKGGDVDAGGGGEGGGPASDAGRPGKSVGQFKPIRQAPSPPPAPVTVCNCPML